LIENLRPRLGEIVPSLRLIAEGVLGEDALIDFVGVETAGRMVLILIGDEGDDLALIGRALAQRAWLEPRIRDWIQLAPNLGLRPGAGVRAVLLCPSFRSETESAAAALGGGAVSLARYRCLRNRGNLEILFDPISRAGARRTLPLKPDATDLPPFRTGLSDDDLDLTADERSELE